MVFVTRMSQLLLATRKTILYPQIFSLLCYFIIFLTMLKENLDRLVIEFILFLILSFRIQIRRL